jgi:hypothetical protein
MNCLKRLLGFIDRQETAGERAARALEDRGEGPRPPLFAQPLALLRAARENPAVSRVRR